MQNKIGPAAADNPARRALSVAESTVGYTVTEADQRFLQERVAENILRLFGAFLLMASYMQWFQPDAFLPDVPLPLPLLTTAMCVATGVALYFFASRGFRRMLAVDMGARRLSVARVNSKGRSVIRHTVPMQQIESLFIQRGSAGKPQATLNIRVKGAPGAIALLSGEQDQLEALHSRLCDDMRTALECAPKRVKRVRPPVKAHTTPRPDRCNTMVRSPAVPAQ